MTTPKHWTHDKRREWLGGTRHMTPSEVAALGHVFTLDSTAGWWHCACGVALPASTDADGSASGPSEKWFLTPTDLTGQPCGCLGCSPCLLRVAP